MFNKYYSGEIAKLATLALALQACTPNTPKANVPDGSITEVKLAGDSVISSKIFNGTIKTEDLADAQITTAKLASGISITGASATFSGTLGVTGATTMAAALTVGTTLGITGAATFSSTGSFADTLTLSKASTATAASDVNMITATLTASPGAASDTNFNGVKNILTGAPTFAVTTNSTFIAGNNVMSIAPTVAQPNFTGWGSSNMAIMTTPFAVKQLVGVFGRAQNSDTNTLTTGIGVDADIKNTTTGTITNAMGFHAKLDNQGGGTITQYIGIKLQDPADPLDTTPTVLAATRYGIVSDGATAVNFFEGRIGVGAGKTNPGFEIDVLGDISASGCLRSSAGIASGACVSDRTLKKDFSNYNVGLAELAKLQPKKYKYNGLAGMPADLEEVGFVAQELEEVIPSLIGVRKLKLHPNDKQDTEVKTVNYTRFIFIAFNAVRELYAKWSADHLQLEQQKQQLASLEKKIELENIALKLENKDLKNRLDKIEQALALSSPEKELKPVAKRKIAAVK